MTEKKAREQIKEWFWRFHRKMVSENPEYRGRFDSIVSESDKNGLLWEVLYFADLYLDIETLEGSDKETLPVELYEQALTYGYNEWIK